jgi:hypothetical protein
MQKAIKESWQEEWIRTKPLIKHQDAYTIDDIEDKIREGIFLLWASKNSAFVTEFVVFPQHTAMNLLFCGGDYKELEAMLPHIEEYAKQCGVKRLYGGGRKDGQESLNILDL